MTVKEITNLIIRLDTARKGLARQLDLYAGRDDVYRTLADAMYTIDNALEALSNLPVTGT